jgi:DNA-directed RNA polymerase alpha subunit
MDYKDRIINIVTTRNITTALFLTNDIAEANLLKRAILSEIETYAIDIVIFQVNTSPRHDEVIALRLAQLVIDHSEFVPPEQGDFRLSINVRGPKEFTTQDIPSLPFKYVTPITELKQGQQIICDAIVKRGQAKQHVKWRPVSKVIIKEVDGGILFTIKDIGMLPPEQIFAKGYEKILDAAQRRPITLFSHPLIPENIVI